MKIAVFHNLPSGGAKRATFEMVRRLARRHTLDIFSLNTANHEFCDLRPYAQQYHIFDYAPLPLFRSPFGLLNHGVRALDIGRVRKVQRQIAESINQGHYDVALVHTDQYTQSPAVLKYLSVPSVYYCQDVLRAMYDPPIARPYSQLTGWRHRVNLINPLRKWYMARVTREDRTSLRAATAILVNSYFSYETVYRMYGADSQVCYLGADIDLFKPLNLPREDFILSVGAIAAPKAFDFILRSLGQVPQAIRPRLIIVGNYVSNDEYAYLDQLARQLGVSVEFRALINDAALVHLYNQTRLTVYAPVLEPFGFVPLESMACGTPVLGVAEGGVRESILHGKTGWLVQRNQQEFAQAIVQLLSQPRLIEELGREGPAYVQENWNWDKSVNNLEQHLETVARQI